MRKNRDGNFMVKALTVTLGAYVTFVVAVGMVMWLVLGNLADSNAKEAAKKLQVECVQEVDK